MSIYVELTTQFNRGHLRAILAGGQAVVLHRLAILCKDGYWILRDDPAVMTHVRTVLAERGARYRFGAPLDVRWLRGGWSPHLEFHSEGLRIRTDFVTRPPRIPPESLDRMWREAEGQPVPFASARDLAEMKKTDREKDYAVIGELARRMDSIDDQLLVSRSARDLAVLAAAHPGRVSALIARRPALATIPHGRDALEAALDAERRQLMRANEDRLARYKRAAERWATAWPELSRKLEGLRLPEAHDLMVGEAERLLPFTLPEERHDRAS
jgi:hypothetical protein